MLRRSCLVVALTALIAAPAFAGEFYLKHGDRVVFYGDSITDQRLYTTFVETYTVTRFPGVDVTFVHSGWGGDRVTGGGGGRIHRRLKRDVFAYAPTVVTIMLGMNDGSYRAFDQKIFDTYAFGYKSLVEEILDDRPGVRLTLIQPSPFDDVTRPPTFEGGYNAVLVRYGEYVKELAQKEKVDVADLNTPVVEALKKANETDPEVAKKIIADRVHPGPAGQLLMAAALLKAWKAPELVADIELSVDGDQIKPVKQKNTTVMTTSARAGVYYWTVVDQALPMPIDLKDPVIALAMKSSDVIKELDQEPLKVTGLSSSEYLLKIDDQEIGRFSREKLAEGVNLAEYATPMAKQAADVHKLTLKHNDVHFLRWRQVQVPLEMLAEDQSMQSAVQGLDAIEADIVQRQRRIANPPPHRFELIPQ
jgi:lysophospholipase L1-like esterase